MSPDPELPVEQCLCRVRHANGVAIVDLSGPLTLAGGAGTVRAKVEILLVEGYERILLNCVGITYVDSAGVGELVSSHCAAGRRGAVLKIAGAQSRLGNLMKLTGLETLIECFPDDEAALESFTDAHPA